MKVYPHFWQDEGTWAWGRNDWREDAKAVDVPKALIDEYAEVLRRKAELNAQIRAVVEGGRPPKSYYDPEYMLPACGWP